MSIHVTSAPPTVTSGMVPHFAAAKLLENGGYVEAMDLVLSDTPLPLNGGKAIQFRRYLIPAVDTTPEAEGINKAPRALTPVDYTGTVDRYAEALQTSTYAASTEPWDIVKAMKENLEPLIMRTREAVRWASARAGSNVFYNSTAITSRGTVNGQITAAPLHNVDRLLKANRGLYFQGAMPGSDREGTSPIEASFLAFCHTNLEADLRVLPGFTVVANYGSGKPVHPNEFGALGNKRFITGPDYTGFADAGASAGTTLLSTSGTNADVYPIVVLAKNAMHAIKFAGAGKEGFGNLKIVHLDRPDKSDWSNARQISGAVWYDLIMRTCEEWMCRIEVAARKNPT